MEPQTFLSAKTIQGNLDLVTHEFLPINLLKAHAGSEHSTRFGCELPEATKLDEILIRLKWKMACPVMIFF